MATLLTPIKAWIDFTGSELTVEYRYRDAGPSPTLPARIGTPRSDGIPKLWVSGLSDVALRLIVTGCDWEVERDPGNAIDIGAAFMICRARYRIHDDDRVAKAPFTSPPVYLVSAREALVTASDGTSETGIYNEEIEEQDPLTVENRSFVDAGGWASIESQGYEPGATPTPDRSIYVDAASGNDSNSGMTEFTPIQTLGEVLSRISQSSFPANRPNRILFRRGQVFGYDGGVSLNKGGLDGSKRLWIGNYLPSNAAETDVRPRIIADGIIASSYTHFDGIEFELGAAAGDVPTLIKQNLGNTPTEGVSAQDCTFPNARDLQIDNLDRCTITAHAEDNPAQNFRVYPTTVSGLTLEITSCFFVNKPGNGAGGHGVYELPPGPDEHNPPNVSMRWLGCRSRIRDCVYVYNMLSDMHRSRAEHQYCSLSRCIQDFGGNGPVGGVNQEGSISVAMSQWSSGTATLRVPASSINGELLFMFQNSDDTWYLRVRAGLPRGYYEVTSLTPDTDPDFYLIVLASTPGSATGPIEASLGDGPWRMRNQSFRHVISFNAGRLADSEAHQFGLGGYGDFAGFWMHDCMAVQANVPGGRAGLQLEPVKSADNLPDLVDVNIENVTIARSGGSGIRLTGESVPTGGQARLRRSIVDLIREEFGSTDTYVIGFWEPRDQELSAASWTCDYNIYCVPSTWTQQRFLWDGSHILITDWQLTGTGNPGQDLNSEVVATIAWSGNAATSYHPDLGDYDADILANEPPNYSGPTRQIHLATLLASRGYRTWDARLTAEVILRWTLRKYKPAETQVWPSNGQAWWIGAYDYRIAMPTNVSASNPSSGTAVISWSASSQSRVTRHIVVYTVNQGAQAFEVEVWNSNSVTLSGFAPQSQIDYRVIATDGWCESASTSIASIMV